MSVNGLSFPTMTNKVNILITISTYLTVALALYETAQLITERPTVSRDQRSLHSLPIKGLITANLCQPMPTYANLCQPIPITANHCQPMPITANHDPKKLIKIVIKMLTLFVMVDNGRQ